MKKTRSSTPDLSRVVNDVRFVPPDDHVEMFGFVVAEKDGELHLRDSDSTWIVRRDDVIGREKWSGAPDDAPGKPVRVHIRADATVRQVREFKLLPSDRPITFPDPERPTRVVGVEELNAIGRRYAAKLGWTPGEDIFGPFGPFKSITTVCCWGTGDFGLDCSGDDCGIP